MNLNIFEDNFSDTQITYVVARYSKAQNKWFAEYEYEEIEDAIEKRNENQKGHPMSLYGIFERIKSECIGQISQ